MCFSALTPCGGVWGQRFAPSGGGHGGGTLRVRQFNGAFIPGFPRNTHLLLATGDTSAGTGRSRCGTKFRTSPSPSSGDAPLESGGAVGGIHQSWSRRFPPAVEGRFRPLKAPSKTELHSPLPPPSGSRSEKNRNEFRRSRPTWNEFQVASRPAPLAPVAPLGVSPSGATGLTVRYPWERGAKPPEKERC